MRRGLSTVRALAGVIACSATLAAGLAAPAAAAPSPTPTSLTTVTSTPQPSPSSTPGTPEASSAAEAAADLEATTAALAEAQALLQQSETDLATAGTALEAARAAVETARAEEEAARVALAAATEAEAKVRREMDGVRETITTTHDTLGAVARTAYQSGPFATLSVVLDASSPSEFADRLIAMETVLQTGGSVLLDLANQRADLANSQDRLEALRQIKEELARQAAERLAAQEAAQAEVASAEAALQAMVQKRQQALAVAETARAEDLQRYHELQAEADNVGGQIRSWAASLGIGLGSGIGSGTFVRPGTGAMTSRFGPRLHPILGYVKVHTGLDLGRGDGKVYAADDGVVRFAGWNKAYGWMTVIDHGSVNGSSLATLYAHQSQQLVTPGSTVRKGQVIGVIGSTGYSTGPHLHFEVRINGTPVDPAPYLAGAPLP